MHNKFNVKDLALISIFTALLFSLEQIMAFIPNVTLTIFLIVLYSKKLGFTKTTIIILIHTFLDNLINGSLNIAYFPFMFLGYFIIPLVSSLFLKKTSNSLILAIFSAIFSFIYCFSFFIPNYFLFNMDMLAYFIADIPFEIVLAVSSFVSTIILYKPLSNLIDRLYK